MNIFSDIYSPIKTKEISEKNKEPFYYRKAYRIIKHSKDEDVTKKDFYPSIMEYNNFVMPGYDVQNRKTNLQLFGTSCYDEKNSIMSRIESITSLREDFENKGWFLMEGSVNKNFGFADKKEESGSNKGHFVYYLFDPIDNSPISDFREIKEVDIDE